METTHHGINSFRLTLCLARRLNMEDQKARRIWAEMKRDICDREMLHRYTRQLARCERLRCELERRAA